MGGIRNRPKLIQFGLRNRIGRWSHIPLLWVLTTIAIGRK